MQALELPEPSEQEKKHSQKLCRLIQQRIVDAGGWIDFEQYMQLALYAPGLGYYSAGAQKFGEQGDFITSPEVSPLFAQALANPLASLLKKMPEAKLIEFGAGSGKLAADLLLALQDINQLPNEYLIIEVSTELQQRQRQMLQEKAPELLACVRWLSTLPPEPVNAIVVANEVIDAMPVQRFSIEDNQVALLGVENIEGELQLSYQPAPEALAEKILALSDNFNNTKHAYYSEINCHINPWIKAISRCIKKGAIYLIDYGYPRCEYYSEDRHMGTFLGYYKHRSVDAPLWYPGLQDLTAFVDFTEVAESALDNGFDVDGFTSQGNFLLNAGLAQLVDNLEIKNEIQHLKIMQQMKTLSMPGEMGERFKVIGLSKGMDVNIPGFEMRDFRYRL